MSDEWAIRRSVSITQADLAAMLGLSRQIVSRILKKLQETGLIEVGYGEIRILYLDAVLLEAEGDI